MIEILKKNPLYICFAGCFILFMSFFFPLMHKEVFWVKQDVVLLSIDGKWMMLLLLMAVLFLLYKKEKYAMLPFLVIILLFIRDVSIALPTFKANQMMQAFSYGAGFYLFILGFICIGVYYIMIFYRVTKKKKHHPKHKRQNRQETK